MHIAYAFELVRVRARICIFAFFTYLPQVYCHYDNIVSALSEELRLVHASLLVLLLNFA